MKGSSSSVDLAQLERYDKIVDLLGMDKERAVYFNNSRS